MSQAEPKTREYRLTENHSRHVEAGLVIEEGETVELEPERASDLLDAGVIEPVTESDTDSEEPEETEE